MKKLLVFISIVGLLIGCSHSSTKLNPSSIEEIDYQILSSYLDQNVEFMLYIGRSDCSDCYYLSQMITDYTNATNTGVYYIDLKTYESSVNEDTYNQFFKQFKFEDVPVLEIIKNGKIKTTYQYLDESYFEIEDRQTQIEEREKYNQRFIEFMNDYFGENYEMS